MNKEAQSALLEEITTRKYHNKQISVPRRTFHHWSKMGLIPFERDDPKGWQKLSLVECVWLGIIRDLRDFGTPLEYIKTVKEAIFNHDTEQVVFVVKEDAAQNLIGKDYEEIDKALGRVEGMADKQLPTDVVMNSPSVFTTVILNCLSTGIDCQLVICNSFISFSAGFIDLSRVPAQVHGILETDSQVRINVLGVISRLIRFQSVMISTSAPENTLNEKEQLILDIIRGNKYSEILIKNGTDGLPINIKVTNKIIDEAVISKLYPFRKKGDYKDFSFKTRNGVIVSYEETDVIKLDQS